MIAAEGLVAVGRMIVAHHRSDGAATNHEIARVTAALQHLTVRDDDLAHRSRAPIAVDPTVRRAAARARSDARVPAGLGELATWQPGHGSMHTRPTRDGKRQHGLRSVRGSAVPIAGTRTGRPDPRSPEYDPEFAAQVEWEEHSSDRDGPELEQGHESSARWMFSRLSAQLGCQIHCHSLTIAIPRLTIELEPSRVQVCPTCSPTCGAAASESWEPTSAAWYRD